MAELNIFSIKAVSGTGKAGHGRVRALAGFRIKAEAPLWNKMDAGLCTE